MKSDRRPARPTRASRPEKARAKWKKKTGDVWLPGYDRADQACIQVRSGTVCTMASVTAHRQTAAISRAM